MPESPSSSQGLGLPFSRALMPLALLTSIFFCVFFSRVLLAPFLPLVAEEFGLNHTESGRLFFSISVGYALSLFLQGFMAKALGHRRSVCVAAAAIGAGLLLVSQAHTKAGLTFALLALGVATGLYLPSGIATVTAVAKRRDWGKALAVHELAPNLSFIAAPALAGLMGQAFTWREVFAVLGLVSLALGLVFLLLGPRHDARGQSPMPGVLARVLVRREFWVLACLFTLGVSVSLASFSMTPLYLVSAVGMDQALANKLVAGGRISGPFLALAAGFVVDGIGARRTARIALVFSGVFIMLLGPAKGWMLWAVVLLQPVMAVFLFTSGFTVLARVFDEDKRNVVISMMIPMAIVVGNGAVPTMIGWFGDRGMFGWGFAVLGLFSLLGVFLLGALPGGSQAVSAASSKGS
jgi:NNP family nitrate/nitrite transporter-like MFS transporter